MDSEKNREDALIADLVRRIERNKRAMQEHNKPLKDENKAMQLQIEQIVNGDA